MSKKTIQWNGAVQPEAIDILTAEGGMIVSPTKVGYIIMTSDGAGLRRKFSAKERNLNKPGVVLVSSLEQLRDLAELTPEIDAFYSWHWKEDVLLGCILPWKKAALRHIPDGAADLVMDSRRTSCFVIRFGTPSELIAQRLWEVEQKLTFASSANPSGQGNKGLVEGIGARIGTMADLVIAADDYVASIQPAKEAGSRYEQGVMVSMVDEHGKIVPEQGGCRSIEPAPTLIRKGLDVDRIMEALANNFESWNYRHGQYY
ncbi:MULTISPECIES: L-threonylcarbamoyladenylate synthase [Rhizobium]|uniref:Sua5/YciO/YrdC/YwlC family protein n=1 Tax=Rhizobium rhododendri TaxID=2506430 RepID=A0ABY8ISB6_9HYPH|nr:MULTISPECIES: Sua5/YciO/YrdC/YwlC family protein [Rhizobium]TQX82233.1 translation factor (SUA5) [Rhizobium sp. rho-13.1]TQY05578.1 translation factor (SUA5) [Rhizobium sp. rho-1.1]WFS25885.1 Sua5/YciO/YrdC/YwlC family protein [Rhizobium rhododendri]